MRIFHLKKMTPYQLSYSLLPCTVLPKNLFTEIKYLLSKYSEMEDDKINLAERWGSLNGAGSCGGTASQSVKKGEEVPASNQQ